MSSIEEVTSKIPPVAPSLFSKSKASLLADARDLIAATKAVQDQIVATVTPEAATFANVLLPLLQDENRRLYESQLIEFLADVHPELDVREASEEAAALLKEATLDTAMRKDLYDLLVAVRDKHEELDEEDNGLLTQMLVRFRKNGLGLGSTKRECLVRGEIEG